MEARKDLAAAMATYIWCDKASNYSNGLRDYLKNDIGVAETLTKLLIFPQTYRLLFGYLWKIRIS